MTPFERNLEMWRQMWRVIERSDLIVQIVDARNPLLFRCKDLETYVKEVDPRKRNLLLVNKADMITENQRKAWADYFDENGVKYTFFSAALASQAQPDEGEEEEQEEVKNLTGDGPIGELSNIVESLQLRDDKAESVSDDDSDIGVPLDSNSIPLGIEPTLSALNSASEDSRTRILPVSEVEALFLRQAPTSADNPGRTTIGLVGYPNVGKSSTINALIKAKKVSVSATPGKTKHFQTIHLSPSVVLCDCPGLVFPNFATTKAELVCNGILSIDQLREFTGPASLVTQRIPHRFLEAVYGIKIPIRPPEEGGTGIPTGEELLNAYGRARGFTKTGVGEPDESRAARYILKDYVNGKLLSCTPPPRNPPIDIYEFNRELYNLNEMHLPQRKQNGGALLQVSSALEGEAAPLHGSIGGLVMPMELGAKSASLDKQFFSTRVGTGHAGHLKSPWARPSQTNGKMLSGRKARAVFAADNGLTPEEAMKSLSGKKHFKGKKRM